MCIDLLTNDSMLYRYVCLSVCLSVCYKISKTLWMNVHESFDIGRLTEQSIKFWDWFGSWSSIVIFKFFKNARWEFLDIFGLSGFCIGFRSWFLIWILDLGSFFSISQNREIWHFSIFSSVGRGLNSMSAFYLSVILWTQLTRVMGH